MRSRAREPAATLSASVSAMLSLSHHVSALAASPGSCSSVEVDSSGRTASHARGFGQAFTAARMAFEPHLIPSCAGGRTVATSTQNIVWVMPKSAADRTSAGCRPRLSRYTRAPKQSPAGHPLAQGLFWYADDCLVSGFEFVRINGGSGSPGGPHRSSSSGSSASHC